MVGKAHNGFIRPENTEKKSIGFSVKAILLPDWVIKKKVDGQALAIGERGKCFVRLKTTKKS